MESFFVKEYGGKMYSDLLTMINSLKRKNYAPAGAFCSLNNGTAFDLSKVISEATITLLIRDHVAERGRFGFVSGFEDYTTLGQYSSLFREERERFQLEQIEENRIVESSPSSIDLQELLRGTHNSSPPNNLEVIEESNESKPPIIIPKGIRKIRI